MYFLNKLLSPLSNLLVNWSARLEGGIPEKTGNNLNKEELDRAIALTVEDQIDNKEANILRGIIKFGNVTTKQIMRSRVDAVAVDIQTDYKSLMKIVKDSGYSRIPVYKEDFDNVEGILYVKDLIGFTDEEDGFNWQRLIREDLLYVPESKKIDDLLKDFQKRRLHMAIVVDEFGGSAGLVTLEDVMEEVVGEIVDEFDEEDEIEYIMIDEDTFVFEGKSMLNDVCRIIGVSTETFDNVKGQSESLGGLILELVGFIPKKKGREVYYDNFKFQIEALTKLRIEKVKITIDR
jgi:gliding motility-associated protein GldE